MYLNNPGDVQGRADWWGGWNVVAGTCRRAVREPGHRPIVRLHVLRRAGRATLRSRSTPRGRAPAERGSDTRGHRWSEGCAAVAGRRLGHSTCKTSSKPAAETDPYPREP